MQTKRELNRRNATTVAIRAIERLDKLTEGRKGTVASAIAASNGAQARISSLFPAERAAAKATFAIANVDLERTVIRGRQ